MSIHQWLGLGDDDRPVKAGRFKLTPEQWANLGLRNREEAQIHVNRLARSDKRTSSSKTKYTTDEKWRVLFWIVVRKGTHDRLPPKLRPVGTRDLFQAASDSFSTPSRTIDKSTISRWWKNYEQPVKAWLNSQPQQLSTKDACPACPNELARLLSPATPGTKSAIPQDIQDIVLQEYRGHRANGLSVNAKNLQLMLQDALRRSPIPRLTNIEVTIRMVDTFKRRHSIVWRKITTKAQKLPVDWETVIKPAFIKLVRDLLLEHNIPLSLFLNLDEVGILVFLASLYTCDEKGSRFVAGVQVDSKAAITKISIIAADGQILPYVLVMPGKKMSNLPDAPAPKGSIFTCTPSHFTNARVTLLVVQQIIIPYVESVRKRDGLRADQKALLLWDNYSGHKSNEIKTALKDANIILQELYPNTTSDSQPLDKLVNAEDKKALRTVMNDDIKEQLSLARDNSTTPEARAAVRLDDVLPHTSADKRKCAATWVYKAHLLLANKPDLIKKSFESCGYVDRPAAEAPLPLPNSFPAEKCWYIRHDDSLSHLLTLEMPTQDDVLDQGARPEPARRSAIAAMDALFPSRPLLQVPFDKLPSTNLPQLPTAALRPTDDHEEEEEEDDDLGWEASEDEANMPDLGSDDEEPQESTKKRKGGPHPSEDHSDSENEYITPVPKKRPTKRSAGAASSPSLITLTKLGSGSTISVTFPLPSISDEDAKRAISMLGLESSLSLHELPPGTPPSNTRIFTFHATRKFSDRTGLINENVTLEMPF